MYELILIFLGSIDSDIGIFYSKIANARLPNIKRCDKRHFTVYYLLVLYMNLFRIAWIPIKDRETFAKLFHFRSGWSGH